jgi:hypothetical protein
VESPYSTFAFQSTRAGGKGYREDDQQAQTLDDYFSSVMAAREGILS